MRIYNPATEELISEIADETLESINHKFHTLRSAQPAWSDESLANRVECIRRFSEAMEKEKQQLAEILSRETGKPFRQAVNEINGARARIKWLADHAARYLADEIMTNADGMQEKISYEPLGVICNISAWNYPWLVGVNVYVPALMAGNTVMYKPSEYATLTGLEMGRLLKQAGIPEKVFQVATGAGQTGAWLLDLDFDGFFFTGSYKTGKYIYEKVSGKMAVCQLELGGKDPLYVTDDISDISSVAAATADGAFYNNGQSCCAVERIYVHEKVYDAYVDAFVKEVKSYRIGLPDEQDVYIGALTRKEQLAVLEDQVKDAVEKGGTLALGGKRIDRKGNYFEPTVILNAQQHMKVMQEESFGPIIGIRKVKDDTEALQLMKDTSYGLTASVYTNAQDRAEKILRQLNVGTGYWNCCDRVSAAVPWSGRNHSGFGATLSHQGIRAFTKPKAWHLKNPK